jgi:hypothetical protein
MNEGKETIHQVRNFPEMWWNMVPNVDRLFAVSSAKLGYVCYSRRVQRPESVLIETLNALLEADFNAVR